MTLVICLAPPPWPIEGILNHTQKNFFKNINHKAHQPCFQVLSPHHLDLGDVDTQAVVEIFQIPLLGGQGSA